MRFHRQQIISCIVLTASILLCELFIKNAELKVGSMAFINLVFICIYYPKRTKETIILFVIFILLMTYFSAKVLSYNPHLGDMYSCLLHFSPFIRVKKISFDRFA